jgi:hypothetical protein
LDEIALAWAAGFFEGEGSVTTSGGRLVLRVNQTHPEPVERFATTIGLGRVYGPYLNRTRDRHRNQRKAFWVWLAIDSSAFDALEVLAPQLTERLLGRAQDVLATVERDVPRANKAYAQIRALRGQRHSRARQLGTA